MSKYKRLTKRNEFGRALMCVKTKSKGCEAIAEAHTKIINRLAELEDKLESGQLLELPCRVGDTIYEIAWHYKWVGFGRVLVPDIIESIFDLDILGSYKTMWFLTKEEAEARLKELQEEN